MPFGITLNQSSTYKEHIRKSRAKVIARIKILRKLTSSIGDATSHVLQTNALDLFNSAAKYACPVWEKLARAETSKSCFK